MGLWLLEGFGALRSEVEQFCPPDEFWTHLQTSEREFLLAWKVLIDAARAQRARAVLSPVIPPAPGRSVKTSISSFD
ncbi:MAG: hypothetical protein HZY76_04815 [Anaerolineae bacterium]|nr:MAG: hypothetical protein HZY76_04815 [Anaerolineae bacterium]